MRIVNITIETEKEVIAKKVNLKKLVYVLSKLENNNNLKYENNEQIEILLKKYNLYSIDFLENINKL